MNLSVAEEVVAQALSRGLPVCSRPYKQVGDENGLTEQQVIEAIASLVDKGVVSRFGLIVKHRKFGYKANAMVVWDVPDEHIDRIGKTFTASPVVTLCYQRPRRLPDWPYNLFCMIHGREREVVLSEVKKLVEATGIENISYDVLFSTHAYKQRGARYDRKGVANAT